MSTRLQTALTAAAILAVASGAARADPVTFSGSFSVSAYTGTDHGLTIDTTANSGFGGGNNVNFTLGEGQSTGAHSLFDIYTPENSIQHDDGTPKTIEVDFAFTSPPPGFGGTATGTTVGQTALFGFYQDGRLTWNDGGTFNIAYPGGGDGLLQVHLTGGSFNLGDWWNLDNSPCAGLTVEASFTNVKDPTPVPEPAGLALFGAGLLGLGTVVKYRRSGNGPVA